MKRIFIVALITLAGAAALVGTLYLLFGRGIPDNARAQLTQYLAHRYPLPPTPVILNAVQATRPWFFKPDESGASYSDTIYYNTTVRYGSRATPVLFPSTPSATPAYAMAYLGQHPVPYPPEDLWCVRLGWDEGSTLVEPSSTTVVVALHQDLYGADWIVHELPGLWSAADRAAALSEWGCGW